MSAVNVKPLASASLLAAAMFVAGPAPIVAQSTQPTDTLEVEPRFTRLFGGDSIAISADPASMLDDRAVAVSPNGEWVAWQGEAWRDGGVWAAPLAGGEPVRVSVPGHDYSGAPVWFPDSRRIAFRSGSGEFGPYIYVATLDPDSGRPTGPPRQVTLEPQPQYGFGISPDGGWIAHVVSAGSGRRAIRVVPSAGGTARTVWEGRAPAWWPAWSPDGDAIYFLGGEPGVLREILRVPVEGGEPERVQCWDDGLIYGLSPDARHVFRLISQQDQSLWELATLDGTGVARFALPEHMAPAGFWPGEPALITAVRDVAAPLLVMQVDGGPVRQLTETRAYDLPLRWMPDGRELFIETQLNGETVHMMAPVDGSAMRQVSLPDPKWGNVAPSISPDGRHVVWFTGDETEMPALKLLDVRTGEARVVIDSVCRPTGIHPAWYGDRFVYCQLQGERHEVRAGAADGRSQLLLAYAADAKPWPSVAVHGDRVAITENDGETGQLILADPGGGSADTLVTLPGQIGGTGSQGPVWAPDGRAVVAAYMRPGEPDHEALVARLTPHGELDGEPVILELDPGPAWWWSPRWLPDASGFVTIGMELDGSMGIWLVSLDPTVAPVELTADDPGPIWAFALSPDGERIVYSSERPAGSSVWKVELSGEVDASMK